MNTEEEGQELVVRVLYTNHRGETTTRTIEPIRIEFRASLFHGDEPQWILYCYDLDKRNYRDFAMKNIKSWEPVI